MFDDDATDLTGVSSSKDHLSHKPSSHPIATQRLRPPISPTIPHRTNTTCRIALIQEIGTSSRGMSHRSALQRRTLDLTSILIGLMTGPSTNTTLAPTPPRRPSRPCTTRPRRNTARSPRPRHRSVFSEPPGARILMSTLSPQGNYYQPAVQNGPGMNQAAYPYPPHARYPADPNQHQMYPPSSHYSPQSNNVSTRSIRPTFVASHPIPASAPYIVHTDDAATKLNDRIRRKCYNCRTTDTSTWRRSSLTPGKVVRIVQLVRFIHPLLTRPAALQQVWPLRENSLPAQARAVPPQAWPHCAEQLQVLAQPAAFVEPVAPDLVADASGAAAPLRPSVDRASHARGLAAVPAQLPAADQW